MTNYLNAHFIIAINALFLALMALGCSWFLNYSQAHITTILEGHIHQGEKDLIELATVTDRNGANDRARTIISDCGRRDEFETLLSRIGVLTNRELITMQQLFESCGPFYALQKAFMVAELSREYDELVSDISLLETVRDLTPRETGLLEWKELVTLEEERSAYLTEQTDLQGKIISLLIEGGKSKEINEYAVQAQNIAESLGVLDARIDTLRTTLISNTD